MLILKSYKPLFFGSLLALSGCASQTGWQPTVDPYGDPNAYRINQDYAECRQLALSASGGTAQETVTGALIGGAIGAASGAAIGAISGNAGAGAAYGAAIGGFGGGTSQGVEAETSYKQAFRNCMRNRGHHVLN